MTAYYRPTDLPGNVRSLDNAPFRVADSYEFTSAHKRQRVYVSGRLTGMITYLKAPQDNMLLGHIEIAGRVADWDTLCAHLGLPPLPTGLPDDIYSIPTRAELIRMRWAL